ncbi:MAG: type II toxin-antitoxin system RelE/ParE family toxin [Pseudomonadota bacterium]
MGNARKVAVTFSARSDLAEIWNYIANDSVQAADGFLLKIEDKFASLADTPNIGAPRGFVQGLRAFPVGSYLIYYLVTDTELQIVRVAHSARDQAALFS